jgi:hypothetical protein
MDLLGAEQSGAGLSSCCTAGRMRTVLHVDPGAASAAAIPAAAMFRDDCPCLYTMAALPAISGHAARTM